MNKNKIRAIFFDYGGVFTEKGEILTFLKACEIKYCKSLAPVNEQSKYLWDNIVIGKMASKDYWDFLGRFFGESGEVLMHMFIEADGYRPEVHEYAKGLKQYYRLGMITNQVKDWFEFVSKERKFDDLFEVIVTSYEAGSVKPNKEIYLYALEKMGLTSDECIFVDDKERNVNAAREVGIKSILFKNLEQLKNDLKELGIEN